MRKKNKSHNGDCFKSAFQFLHSPIVNTLQLHGELRLCHGICTGTGNGIEGVQFIHAWCEDDLFVYDYSNGRECVCIKSSYYHTGNITDVRRYTKRHSLNMALNTGHYGWWDAECFQSTQDSIRAFLRG